MELFYVQFYETPIETFITRGYIFIKSKSL